jgi:hypothetical protein
VPWSYDRLSQARRHIGRAVGRLGVESGQLVAPLLGIAFTSVAGIGTVALERELLG